MKIQPIGNGETKLVFEGTEIEIRGKVDQALSADGGTFLVGREFVVGGNIETDNLEGDLGAVVRPAEFKSGACFISKDGKIQYFLNKPNTNIEFINSFCKVDGEIYAGGNRFELLTFDKNNGLVLGKSDLISVKGNELKIQSSSVSMPSQIQLILPTTEGVCVFIDPIEPKDKQNVFFVGWDGKVKWQMDPSSCEKANERDDLQFGDLCWWHGKVTVRDNDNCLLEVDLATGKLGGVIAWLK